MKKRSIISVFVVLAMMISMFSACSSQKKVADIKEEETVAKVKPTLKWLIASSSYDLEKDAGSKLMREASGYNIDFQMLSGKEQLMLIISSGEPYDYIYLTKDNYNMMMSNNALMDITDMLNKHGSNIKKAIPTLWPATTVNGKIFGIPSTVAQPDSLSTSIVARGDLLDKAGIKTPTKVDEFYTMLESVKKAYPDMIPLTVDASQGNGGYFLPNIAGAFGISGLWQVVNGKLTPIIKHPNLKAYLEYMVKLYKNGLLDNEMPALNSNNKMAKFSTGKAVMLYNSWSGVETPIGALRKLVPDLKVAVMPIFTDKDGKAVVETKSGIGSIGAIPATSKNPVDCIKAINAIIDLDNFTKISLGDSGVHYTKNSDGSYKLIQPAFNNERVNSNIFVSGFYREDVYPKMWEGRLSKNADLEYVFNTYKASIKGIGFASPVSLAPAMTAVDNMDALDTYVKDYLNGIVAGVNTVDSLSKAIDYWNANGGQKVEAFYSDWYSKNIKK